MRRKGKCKKLDQPGFADMGAANALCGNLHGIENRRSVTSRRINLGALLEAFVQSRRYVPPGARHIRSEEELPLALRVHTRKSHDGVWRAWNDGSRVWFVKAKPLSGEPAAALQMMFFDMDGRLTSSRIWSWAISEPAALM